MLFRSMVGMPPYITNTKKLKGYAKYAPDENKDKLMKIAELYEARKIPKFETADNLARSLTNLKDIKTGKANRDYNKFISKYETALPMTGRLEREATAKQAKREATKETAYDVSLLLFKKADAATKHNDTVGDVDVYVPAATKEQKQEKIGRAHV